jgi:hypothetical protein
MEHLIRVGDSFQKDKEVLTNYGGSSLQVYDYHWRRGVFDTSYERFLFILLNFSCYFNWITPGFRLTTTCSVPRLCQLVIIKDAENEFHFIIKFNKLALRECFSWLFWIQLHKCTIFTTEVFTGRVFVWKESTEQPVVVSLRIHHHSALTNNYTISLEKVTAKFLKTKKICSKVLVD